MRIMSVVALLVVGAFAGSVVAEDKEKDKPLTGSYTRKAGDIDLKMVFKKDNLVDFHATIGEVGCIMSTKYTKEKDGTYKCEVTNFEKKGDFPVTKEKGYKFSFKLETKDKKVVVSNVEGDELGADQKQAIEGEYEMKSD